MEKILISKPAHYFLVSTLHINPNYQTSGFGFEARKAVLLDNNLKPTVWARQAKLFCKCLEGNSSMFVELSKPPRRQKQ